MDQPFTFHPSLSPQRTALSSGTSKAPSHASSSRIRRCRRRLLDDSCFDFAGESLFWKKNKATSPGRN